MAKKLNDLVKNILPIFSWLPEYKLSQLGSDAVSGAAVWAVIVPLAMACAMIFNVDPIVGLYTLPLALAAYAFFGGSQSVIIGPDTTVAVLSGGIIATYAAKGHDPLMLAVLLAALTGVIYFIFFVLKMGWIVDLIPEPVLKGFVEGLIWLTIVKQLGALLGIDVVALGPIFEEVHPLFNALSNVHALTASLGLASIVFLLAFKRFAPHIPAPILLLIAIILIVGLFGLEKKGIEVVGDVGAGSFSLSIPEVPSLGLVISLFPSALAIVVLGFTKSFAALKLAAEQSGETIDPDRELLAIGASNLGSSISGGYGVAGSLTATTINLNSGGKTQVVSLITALLCLLTLLFLLPILANIALCSLAAIIIVALSGLSDIKYFRTLWKAQRAECLVGILVFAGVLLLGVIPGILVGIVLALFKIGYLVHKPLTAIIGQTPAGSYVDVEDHSDAKETPGLVIWRPYGPLVFLNARILAAELRERAEAHHNVKVVVLDATAAAGIDSSAAEALIGACKDLEAAGISLWVVDVREEGWKLVSTISEGEGLANVRSFESLSQAKEEFHKLHE
ncbi:MAG: SulP family inorganic anion transporter [Hyphomicrobiales bacterium]